MKTSVRIGVILLVLIYVAGCNARAQWSTARVALTTTEQTLRAAHSSGAMSDKDFVLTDPYVKAAQTGLKEADAELVANNDKPTNRFRFYMNLVNKTLSALQKPPTTQPSGG